MADEENEAFPLAKKQKVLTSDAYSGRAVWSKDNACMPFQEWLKMMKPSTTTPLQFSWIQVRNSDDDKPEDCGFPEDFAAYMQPLNKIETMIDDGKRIPAKVKAECVHDLLEIAKRDKHTVGKWMLFVDPKKADTVWKEIATATVEGRLGCSAKIAPYGGGSSTGSLFQPQEQVLCCVYVKDCTDKKDVKRVLMTLQEEMGYEIKAGLKPDIYTYLGIYQNNPWRLNPTLYPVKEVMEWGDLD